MGNNRKVAAITGAAGGIGRALARGFAGEGYTLAVIGVKPEALTAFVEDSAFAEVEVAEITGDLADASACDSAMQQALDQVGRVDVLVNNAGIGAFSPLTDLSVEEIDRVLDINGRAPLLLTRAILPHMVERGSGSIVSISSAAAKWGHADLAPYSASKAALVGFTRALAVELAQTGVRVNAVCPGPTNTPMMENNVRTRMVEEGVDYEEALDHWVGDIPTRKMIEPEDIADAVLFLVSERARSITGEALNVSGGMVMW